MNAQELLKLKEQIETKMRQKAQLEGQLTQVLNNLKSLGYESIEDAKQAVEKLTKRKQLLEEKYTSQLSELRKALDSMDLHSQ